MLPPGINLASDCKYAIGAQQEISQAALGRLLAEALATASCDSMKLLTQARKCSNWIANEHVCHAQVWLDMGHRYA